MRFILLYIYVTLFCCLSYAQSPAELKGTGVYSFNEELKEVFNDALDLKVNKAILALKKIKPKNKFNLMPYYIEDYIEFIKAFTNGKERFIYEKYNENRKQRIKWMKEGNQGDPYFLYTQLDMELRWAFIATLQNDMKAATIAMKAAYSLLKKNKEKFPGFTPNKKADAFMKLLAASMPAKVKLGGELGKLKGNLNEGLKLMHEVLDFTIQNPDFDYKKESNIFFSAVLLYSHVDSKDIWAKLNKTNSSASGPLSYYASASHYIRIGQSKRALMILNKFKQEPDVSLFPRFILIKREM